MSKKKKIVVSAITVLVVAALVVGGFLLFPSKPAPIVKKVAVAKPIIIKPVSTTVASPLTGLQVAPAIAKLPVTGVMVENSDEARPQSGLSQAGIIFEALAEGGITRFMAVFQNNQSSQIGPVRSARPYFIDWLLPFDAGYAHVGGSPAALNQIQADNVRDMDQSYFSSYYTRITSREAPHNVYTTLNELSTLETSQGWTSSTFTGFPRKADDPAKTPTATSITLNPSNSDMESNYTYSAQTNSYERSEAGAPMVDANTNLQLNPKVVIGMVVPWTDGALDSSDAYYTDYSDIGSGAVYVFQDGTVTEGTWEKASATSQIEFNTDSGAPIQLNAGQTWITALGDSSEITYSD